MEDNPLKNVLARHGITDPEKYLLSKGVKEAQIDCTLRIDGVPIMKETVKQYCDRIGKKLRWL